MKNVGVESASFLACLAALGSAQGICPPQGLSLAIEGGRLGDDIVVELAGPPSAVGWIGVDTGSGPVGSFCLDLSPQLVLIPVGLDAAGAATLHAPLPAVPALRGLELFAQALTSGGPPPLGLAVSNGDSAVLYPPRVYLMTGVQGAIPAKLIYLDALNDTPGAEVTGGVSAVHLPELRCLAVLRSSSVECFDDETGALTASIPVPPPVSPSVVNSLVRTDVPGVLLVVHYALAGPGAVSVVQVDAGVVSNQIPLTAMSPIQGIAAPGTTLAYLRGIDSSDVVGIDFALGLEVSTAALNPNHGLIWDWLVLGDTLLTLHTGSTGPGPPAVLQGVDIPTGAPAFAGVFPVQGAGIHTAIRMRYGPSPIGPAILVLFQDDGEIVVVDPATLAVVGSKLVPAPSSYLELSPGGTEWLALQTGYPGFPPFLPPSPGRLIALDAGTFAVLQTIPLPMESQTSLTALPSNTLRKAYVTSGSSPDLHVFPTDPTAGPGAVTPIPATTFVKDTLTN